MSVYYFKKTVLILLSCSDSLSSHLFFPLLSHGNTPTSSSWYCSSPSICQSMQSWSHHFPILFLIFLHHCDNILVINIKGKRSAQPIDSEESIHTTLVLILDLWWGRAWCKHTWQRSLMVDKEQKERWIFKLCLLVTYTSKQTPFFFFFLFFFYWK